MTITIRMIINELKKYKKFIDEHYPIFNECRSNLLLGKLTVDQLDTIFHLLNSIDIEFDTIIKSLEVLK